MTAADEAAQVAADLLMQTPGAIAALLALPYAVWAGGALVPLARHGESLGSIWRNRQQDGTERWLVAVRPMAGAPREVASRDEAQDLAERMAGAIGWLVLP